MKNIAHVSDLHFGRTDPALVEALASEINRLKPDLVVVSGDLTQRAREREYQQARDFLRSLPFPQIVVPGNHDVPLHNVISRFRAPLDLYRQYITDDLGPWYCDSEMAAVGVNTARSWTWKNGRINRVQISATCRKLDRCSAPVRIIVTHHPLDLPPDSRPRDLVGRARMAMLAFADSNVDLFLSGHFHLSSITRTAERYRIRGHAALVIQAGTAISTRHRGELNSWNLLRIAASGPRAASLAIHRFVWSPHAHSFASMAVDHFRKTSDGWSRTEPHLDDAPRQRRA